MLRIIVAFLLVSVIGCSPQKQSIEGDQGQSKSAQEKSIPDSQSSETKANSKSGSNVNTSTLVDEKSIPVAPQIDGAFDDWMGAKMIAVDAVGDAKGKFDIVDVAAVISGNRLLITFELEKGDSLTLQNGEKSDGTLQLLVYRGDKKLTVDFRERKFFDKSQSLMWSDVGFRCMPTYASNRYELQLELEGLKPGEVTIDFAGSDSLDAPAIVNAVAKPTAAGSVDLNKSGLFRVANLNTLHSGLANEERATGQFRMIKAVKADIYTFQEEWKEPLFEQAIPQLSKALGADVQTAWFGGCAIASPLPMETLSMTLDRAVAGLVKLQTGQHVVVVSVHFKSRGYLGSSEDDLRIQQAQQLVGEIKKMRNGDFGEDAKNAPVIVVGDYNLVGSKKPLETLMSAGLTDVLFTNPKSGEAFTWQGGRSFSPGRLDLLCHSEQLTPVNSIILNSSTLDTSELGILKASDSASSDHLMLIGDFDIAN